MKQNNGYIEKFLKRTNRALDSAIEQGIRRADEILDDAVELGKITSAEAQRRSIELRRRAKQESKKLRTHGKKRLTQSIDAAKRAASSQGDALETLSKLGELRKAGIITEAEFKSKKKKLLARI